MNKSRQEIIDRYPVIFMDDPELSVGDDWLPLIDELCSLLQRISYRSGFKVVARQVKEKFGGLRFYYRVEIPEKDCSGMNDFQRETYDLCNEQWESRISAVVSIYESLCGQEGKK